MRIKNLYAAFLALVLTLAVIPATSVLAQGMYDTNYFAYSYEAIVLEYELDDAMYYEMAPHFIFPEYGVYDEERYETTPDFGNDFGGFEIEIFEIIEEYLTDYLDIVDITTVESMSLEYFLQSDIEAFSSFSLRESPPIPLEGFSLDEVLLKASVPSQYAEDELTRRSAIEPFSNNMPIGSRRSSVGQLFGSGHEMVYEINITQRSMFTALLHMPSNVDFDLFVLRHNGLFFELIAQSYRYNPEIIRFIADPGQYFIVVSSWFGAGQYILDLHAALPTATTHNNTMARAIQLPANNFNVTGNVICLPGVRSFYRTSLSGMREVTFSFTPPNGVNARLLLIMGNSVSLIQPGVTYSIPAGIIYLVVESIDSTFNPNSQSSIGMASVPHTPNSVTGVTTSGTAVGPNNRIWRNGGRHLTIRGRTTLNGTPVGYADLVVGARNQHMINHGLIEHSVRSDSFGNFEATFVPSMPTTTHEGNSGYLFVRRSDSSIRMWRRDVFFGFLQ